MINYTPIKYEFQGGLYRSLHQMLMAMTVAWIGSGKRADDPSNADVLARLTDEELAAECIGAWGLDVRSGETEWTAEDEPEEIACEDSHMDINMYDEADLAAAFGDFREAYVPATSEEA